MADATTILCPFHEVGCTASFATTDGLALHEREACVLHNRLLLAEIVRLRGAPAFPLASLASQPTVGCPLLTGLDSLLPRVPPQEVVPDDAGDLLSSLQVALKRSKVHRTPDPKWLLALPMDGEPRPEQFVATLLAGERPWLRVSSSCPPERRQELFDLVTAVVERIAQAVRWLSQLNDPPVEQMRGVQSMIESLLERMPVTDAASYQTCILLSLVHARLGRVGSDALKKSATLLNGSLYALTSSLALPGEVPAELFGSAGVELVEVLLALGQTQEALAAARRLRKVSRAQKGPEFDAALTDAGIVSLVARCTETLRSAPSQVAASSSPPTRAQSTTRAAALSPPASPEASSHKRLPSRNARLIAAEEDAPIVVDHSQEGGDLEPSTMDLDGLHRPAAADPRPIAKRTRGPESREESAAKRVKPSAPAPRPATPLAAVPPARVVPAKRVPISDPIYGQTTALYNAMPTERLRALLEENGLPSSGARTTLLELCVSCAVNGVPPLCPVCLSRLVWSVARGAWACPGRWHPQRHVREPCTFDSAQFAKVRPALWEGPFPITTTTSTVGASQEPSTNEWEEELI
jgi:hypothetical protein